MAERIYTRTGDRGQTGLFGGWRVEKDAARVEAYGAVDELNAVVGWARSCDSLADHDLLLRPIQDDLFQLGADLATPGTEDEQRGARSIERVSTDRIEWLERAIDEAERELPALSSFILPGGAELASRLHVARTVCRRAERRCVALSHVEEVNPLTLAYLNRLSDLLFVLARLANSRAGVEDTPWPARARQG